MMICPETFYEYNLKGKNADQIMTVIRGLKREMGRLKNVMEHPEYAPTMCPTESTQLWCNRLYLERAKEAYAEAGGSYKPSVAEQKSADLDASIPFVCKVVFTIGGYFGGYETRTCTIEEDRISTQIQHSLAIDPSDTDEVDAEELDKESFLEQLKDLHIGEWRKHYNLKRFGYVVMDGTQWELELYFSNDHKTVKITGDNAYPHNFDKLKELFGMELYDYEECEEDDE